MAEHTDPEHGHDFPEKNPSVAFDRSEENVKAVSGFGIGLAIGVVVVVFMMWGLFDWFYNREDEASATITPAQRMDKPQLPPEPRLQAEPRLDLAALREGEDAVLGENGKENEKRSYAWVDPNHGVARIPIQEAIKIIAAKGLPSRPATNLPDSDGFRQIPSVASSGRTLEKISQ